MSKEFRPIVFYAAAFAASFAANAQMVAPERARPIPAAPSSPYNSAFEGYRPFSPAELGDWRKANETVRDVGGWRAYAREMRGGAESPAASEAVPQGQDSKTAPVQPMSADPHAGHHQ